MKTRAYFLDFEYETESIAFYPRHETEILVDKACDIIKKLREHNLPCNALDLGTGCGNIAISLTKYISSCRMVASDISDSSLCVARSNAARYGVLDRIEFVKSNLFLDLGKAYRNFFDIIISNPPYIALSDFSTLSEVVKDDPYISLYGGRDGLRFYRIITGCAHLFLKKKGVLLLEIGYDQAQSVKNLLLRAGFFTDIEVFKDLSRLDRVLKASLK